MSSKIETVQTPRRLLDVLRFWLERANERSESGDIAELVELRALLAAPVCKVCKGAGWIDNLRPAGTPADDCHACKPAAQHQRDTNLVDVIAREMNRLGYGLHESHAASILHAVREAQNPDELAAPIAWHIGGNGYDKVEFTYPSWVGELGNGRPSVSEICTVDDLAELLARIGSSGAPLHHPAEQSAPKTFLQERAQLDQEWAGLRELQRLSRQPEPVVDPAKKPDPYWPADSAEELAEFKEWLANKRLNTK